MEKRTILAIVISLLILIGYEYFYKKYFPPAEPPQVAERSVSEPQAVSPEKKSPDIEKKVSEPILPPSETDTPAAEPQQIVVQCDLYKAVLDNKGAVFSSWILKDYTSGGDPFEMVSTDENGEKWSRPGSLYFEDTDISSMANESLYEVTVDGQPYSGFPVKAPVDVVMTLRRGDISIQKSYKFLADNFTVDLKVKLQKGGNALDGEILLAQDIGPIKEHIEGRYTKLQSVYFDGQKVRRKSVPDQEDGNVAVSGNIQWVGLDMHYFAIIAIPEKSIPSYDTNGYQFTTKLQDGSDIKRSLLGIKIPVKGSQDYFLYLGPKKQSFLKAVPKFDLSGVIDYGWFTIIALPLLSALRWIHTYVHNYGLAIIVLTLILSILLFPLRLKQMLSMKKMQHVQPKVKAIQERYKKYKKTDPKRADMNQEIMALYKEHHVNPMGGCLPMLVQMPLLFAFYRLLSVSFELRQAPFFGWIQDLSAKDPYYILPIVMGITMFLSQKMTPMAPTADNSQAKMMQYLPVVFTFMFLQLSAGLNLYFLCSNIFQVGFQKIYEVFAGDGRKGSKPRKK